VLLLQMPGKTIICLPSDVFREELNAAEKRRFEQLRIDLIFRGSREHTVILKGLTNTAYNGRMGNVMGVRGLRTVVSLMPDGETRSFPTANVSQTMNGAMIACVNDTTTLREFWDAGDRVVFFETDAILLAPTRHQDVSATMQVWPGGPHLPTAKVMAFYDLSSQHQFPAQTRSRDALAMLQVSGAAVNMTVANATDEDLRDFWTSVLAIQDDI